MKNDGVATPPKIYGVRGRRIRALERLQVQLAEAQSDYEYADDSLKDPLQKAFAPNVNPTEVLMPHLIKIERIKKEISILKTRI